MESVAVAVKATLSGAGPIAGEAPAVQATEQTGVELTVIAPDFAHVTPLALAVMVQENVPSET